MKKTNRPVAQARSQLVVSNEFAKGPEGWCSYDYHASVVSNKNIFILATWAKECGVRNGNCIWVDHTRWSADTPEKPLSILPLLFYRSWVDADPIDLRGREVSVHLRGDDLQQYGASCFFWVVSGKTRWHYTARPLKISKNRWAPAPQRFVLRDDETLWHRSWADTHSQALSLTELLGNAQSYGFSFTGFTSEVHGRLSMAKFRIGRGPGKKSVK